MPTGARAHLSGVRWSRKGELSPSRWTSLGKLSRHGHAFAILEEYAARNNAAVTLRPKDVRVVVTRPPHVFTYVLRRGRISARLSQ